MKNILIVSSSTSFLERNKNLLARSNFLIHTTKSGHDALKLHKEAPVDMMIVELQLDDMGGEEFCDLVRRGAVKPEVPLVIVYHNVTNELLRARQSSADVLMAKPVLPEQFLKVVGQYIEVDLVRHKRVELSVRVLTKMDVIAFTCISHNISVKGMLLETSKQLMKGDRIVCIFSLPNSDDIRVDAEVIRSVRIMSGGYQHGIRFINLTLQARMDIENYIGSFKQND